MERWNKLAARDRVDITTVAGIHHKTHSLIKEFLQSDEISLYTYYNVHGFTNYINFQVDDFGKFLYGKYIRNSDDLKKLITDGDEIIASSERIKSEWLAGDLHDLQEIKKIFVEFSRMFEKIGVDYSMLIFIIIEYWQKHLIEMLDQLISKNNLEPKRELIYSSLLRPSRNTALMELKDDLSSNLDKKDLLEKYQFLRTWSLVWYKPLDADWLENIEADKQNDQQFLSTDEVISLLNPSEGQANEIKMAPEMVYIKDYRDDLRRKFSYIWIFLFEEISEATNVPHHDIGYLTLDEIGELLSGKDFSSHIDYRKEKPCVITAERDPYRVVIKENEAVLGYHDWENEGISEKEAEVFGISTFSGIVSGKVKIVNSIEDIVAFPRDFILVANSTHPDYLPAMQKAAAFVTNEGGVLCHAAIVARELKKPCIVGTKNATKVFSDGDTVEVDAERGIVRKI